MEASITHEAIYWLPSKKYNVRLNGMLLVLLSLLLLRFVYEKNVNPVELMSEKGRIRIVNTLFKVKLEALAIFFLRISKETVLPSTFG